MSKPAAFTSELCLECPGRCCSKRRLGLTALWLTTDEAKKKLFEPHVQWDADGPKLSLDPQCVFLGKDNRCTIYAKRPQTCRTYVCWGHSQIMADVVVNRPTHRELLKRWKCLPGQLYGLPLDEDKLVAPI